MRAGADDTTGDEGFGLVEVMVSMLLFAILLMMTLLLLVNAIRMSARNSTLESATQWAVEQVDAAHTAVAGLSATDACPKWTALVNAPAPANRSDARGLEMAMIVSAETTPANCLTTGTAPVVSYQVTVVDAKHPSTVLATTTTKIALGLE